MSGTDASPLVAERVDSTRAWSGIFLAESIEDLVHGVESGSWVDLSIGGVAGSLEALAFCVDPLGQLAAWGVGWLLEHVQPLSDALDSLAGDPDQITAYAQTWQNIAQQVTGGALELSDSVRLDLAAWTGSAAAAYHAHAGAAHDALQGIAQYATAMAKITQGAGLVVALVRELVRDLIAEFVGVLAVRLPEWLAEEGLTLGLATPLVVSQVSALVAKWAARIARLLHGLVTSLRRLAGLLRHLDELVRSLQDVLRRLARRAHTGGGPPTVPPPIRDGPTLRTKEMPEMFRHETDPYDPLNPFPGHSVQRLTDDEREARRLFVGPDGLLYRSDGRLFDTRGSDTHWGGADSDRAIFVMDEHGNIYASTYQRRGDFHHSSLSNGQPIAGAGELHVENGRVIGITDQSGHYRPGRSMTLRVAETLRSQGVDLDGVQILFTAPEGT